MTFVSPAVARALSGLPGEAQCLYLDGLRVLSKETALAFSEHQGVLSLDALTTLPEDVALALAEHKGSGISLNGLSFISEGAAVALGRYKGERLSLNGLTAISAESVAALFQFLDPENYVLELNGLEFLPAEFPPDFFERLSGDLELSGLSEISPENARALSKHRGWLELGVTSLSDGAAQALSMHRGERLALNGLTSISKEAANALQKHRGINTNLNLDALSK